MAEPTMPASTIPDAGRTAHTPGPWVVTTCMDYWVEPASGLKDGEAGIALCGDIHWPGFDTKQAEWGANARLIAAAPTMAAALLKVARAGTRDEQLVALAAAKTALEEAGVIEPTRIA